MDKFDDWKYKLFEKYSKEGWNGDAEAIGFDDFQQAIADIIKYREASKEDVFQLIKDLQEGLSRVLGGKTLREYEHLQVRCEKAIEQEENPPTPLPDCNMQDFMEHYGKSRHVFTDDVKDVLKTYKRF